MKSTIKLFGCSLLIAAFIIPVGTSLAQPSAIDQARLNRDLRIMEGVLDRLLRGKSAQYYFNGHSKGVYLPGFGIVFHTSKSRPSPFTAVNARMLRELEEERAVHEEKRDRIREEMTAKQEEIQSAYEKVQEAYRLARTDPNVLVADEFGEERSEEIRKKEEESLENLKENIYIFFQNYAPAIGQLGLDERIAVLVNLKDWRTIDSDDSFLRAWVIKKNLDNYRRARMNADDFRNLIHYQLDDAESEIDTDIGIFTEIVERALGTESVWRSSSNNGIYLNGLGALMFMNLGGMFVVGATEGDEATVYVQDGRFENIVAYARGETKDKKKKGLTLEEYMTEVEDNLFDLVASYGHTLRLDSRERIVLNVNLGPRMINFGSTRKGPSRLILQLNKSDIDKYYEGAMTLTELRKRLVKQEY